MDAAEVRKFDNKKCAVFIRGYDTVIDDKYHTPESREFKDSVALGPYKHRRDTDLNYELGKINFYLNSYPRNKFGDKVPECYAAFRSQINRYGFICEESDEYSRLI